MTPALDITADQQKLLRQLLQQFLPAVGVWAFGSRIKGCARPSSDLDLVLFANAQQRPQVFALQEALEESNLPFKVDLLIWNEIPDNFKTNIQNQFVELVANAGHLTPAALKHAVSSKPDREAVLDTKSSR